MATIERGSPYSYRWSLEQVSLYVHICSCQTEKMHVHNNYSGNNNYYPTSSYLRMGIIILLLYDDDQMKL